MEREQQPFNEADVLRELERLQQAIQAARGERRQAVEKFESFLRVSKSRETAERVAQAPTSSPFNVPPVELLPPRPQSPEPGRPQALEPGRTEGTPGTQGTPGTPGTLGTRGTRGTLGTQPIPPVEPLPPKPAPAPPPAVAAAAPAPPAAPVPAVPPVEAVSDRVQTAPLRVAKENRASRPALIAAIVGVLLLVSIGFLFTRPKQNEVPAAAPAAGQAPQTTPPAAGPAPRAVQVPEPAPQTKALRVELITDRPVWMRVIVDGQKVAEREYPAGQTLTFDADKAVVVRAGDAGAVRVKVGGKEQGTVGVTGQPITRVFTPPGGAAR